MSQFLYESYCPLTGKDLEKFEKLIGHRLPDEYRDFVSKYGESCFGESVIVKPIAQAPKYIAGEKNLLEVISFLGMTEDYGIVDRYEVFREQERMPASIIPIASDLRNYFCLGISDDAQGIKRGSVYLWDSQGESPDEEDYVKDSKPIPDDRLHHNLTLVADGFADFISRLESDPNS